MRELDVLLTRYLEQRFGAASDEEKAAFEALLTLPDPQIAAYLLRNQEPGSAAIARVVRHILQ
jgi:antitoxin CptB